VSSNLNQCLNDVVELDRAEDGLNVAQDLFYIPTEALKDELPVLIVLELFGKLDFLDKELLWVIDKEEEEGIVICVMNKFEEGWEVFFVVDVELVVDLHEH